MDDESSSSLACRFLGLAFAVDTPSVFDTLSSPGVRGTFGNLRCQIHASQRLWYFYASRPSNFPLFSWSSLKVVLLSQRFGVRRLSLYATVVLSSMSAV